MRQFRNYIIAGVVNVGIGYFFFAFFFFFIGIKEIAVTFTTLIMIYLSSLIKSKISFKGKKINHKSNILAFVIIYLLNIFLLMIFVDLFHINVYIAQIFTMGFVILFRYVMDRKFVFLENKSSIV